jgi:uncharacterized tellurite resistance protein B-like protein
MRSIQRLLGLVGASEDRDTDTVRRIAAELDQLPPAEARYLAAFAYVLARVAHADMQISGAELERMQSLICGEGNLPAPQAALVAQLAGQQALHFGGTEDYLVTRQFRALATRDQCLGLVSCLYHVAAAENAISNHEDARIRQIAGELGVTHAELAALRLQFRSDIAELRRPS